MGVWRAIVWLVARKTGPGSRYLYGDQEAALTQKMGRLARVAYQRSLEQEGRDLQYRDEDCKVLVKMGLNRDRGCYVTDIIVKPLGPGWRGGRTLLSTKKATRS